MDYALLHGLDELIRQVKAARTGAKLAVKYGPQAKLAWDRGGKQAATAAQSQTLFLVARRKGFAEAATVRNDSVLKRMVDGSRSTSSSPASSRCAPTRPGTCRVPALLNHRGTLTP